MNPSRIRRNIDPFDGTDYITWKIRNRAHLKELQLIKLINEEVPENKTIEWIKNNDQAVNEIMDYLANSHIGYISSENPIAKKIFKKLDDTYYTMEECLLTIKDQTSVSFADELVIFLINCTFKARYEKRKNQQKRNEGPSANIKCETLTKSKNIPSRYFAGMAGNTSTHSLDGVEFIIDSGASHHIINDDKIFEEWIYLDAYRNPDCKKGHLHLCHEGRDCEHFLKHWQARNIRRRVVLPRVPGEPFIRKEVSDGWLSNHFSCRWINKYKR